VPLLERPQRTATRNARWSASCSAASFNHVRLVSRPSTIAFSPFDAAAAAQAWISETTSLVTRAWSRETIPKNASPSIRSHGPGSRSCSAFESVVLPELVVPVR
jgi:hypothetical protein